MKSIVLAVLLFALPALAFAQQQQPSPEMQAMQAEVLQQLNAKLQCTMQAITLQQQVQALTAERDAFKEKYEPAKK